MPMEEDIMAFTLDNTYCPTTSKNKNAWIYYTISGRQPHPSASEHTLIIPQEDASWW